MCRRRLLLSGISWWVHRSSRRSFLIGGGCLSDLIVRGLYIVVIDLIGGKVGFFVDGCVGVTVIMLGNHCGLVYCICVDPDGMVDDRLFN